MSRITRSGRSVAHELDGFVAAAGFADDVVALLLEELPEIEADDRLVLGDHDARSAPDARSAMGAGYARTELGRHAVEELVLLALRARRSGAGASRGAGPGCRRAGGRRAPRRRQAASPTRARGAATSSASPSRKTSCSFGDRELGPEPLESFAHVDEATLQDRARHGRISLRRRLDPPLACSRPVLGPARVVEWQTRRTQNPLLARA